MKVGCKLAMGASLVFCAALASLFLFAAASDYHKIAVLQKRGVETHATVTVMTLQQKNTTYLITYSYLPIEYRDKHYTALQGQRTASPEARQTLDIGSVIPVIYDPLRPDRQMWMSGDDLKILNPLAAQTALMQIGIIVLLFGTAAAFLIYAAYLRDKRLLKWGRFCQGRIVSESERDAVYEFIDSTGMAQTGVERWLPDRREIRPAFIEFRERRLSNPIIVFLPQKSSRNALYPPWLAELPPIR